MYIIKYEGNKVTMEGWKGRGAGVNIGLNDFKLNFQMKTNKYLMFANDLSILFILSAFA